MCIAIVGGVKKSEREYKNLAKKHGIKCKLFNQNVPDFSKKIQNVDALILFTNTVSHKLSCKACKVCKKNDITLKRPHSTSLNQLNSLLKELKSI